MIQKRSEVFFEFLIDIFMVAKKRDHQKLMWFQIEVFMKNVEFLEFMFSSVWQLFSFPSLSSRRQCTKLLLKVFRLLSTKLFLIKLHWCKYKNLTEKRWTYTKMTKVKLKIFPENASFVVNIFMANHFL